MKRVYLGAAALLLGSSALVWAADKPLDTDSKAIAIGAKTFDLAKDSDWAKPADAPMKAKPIAETWFDDSNASDSLKVEPAAATWFDDSKLSGGAKPEPAALTADDEAVLLAKKGEGDPDLDLAVKPGQAQPDPVATETGVGGPLEEVDAATASTADLAPRPATQNYPACSHPGPGDDNCIQLYEPGVRQQLASWTRPTGGLAGADETRMAAAGAPSETGVGGPYEPVEDSTELTMNGDGSIDGAMGEVTADESVATAANSGVEAYAGMGGPLEEVTPVQAKTDYPPCSHPGPGDDNCIQLYERGVSGR